MLNDRDFREMEKELSLYDKEREFLINKSREILKNSKSAIYCVHRNELEEAHRILKDNEVKLIEIKKIIKREPFLRIVVNDAFEEYSEAMLFYGFVKNRKIITRKELDVDSENYLGGMADLTGELSRRAVILAIQKKIREVEEIRDLVDEVFGHFLKFDFRNGDLRRKSDSIKWNLNKIEEILYDLKRSETKEVSGAPKIQKNFLVKDIKNEKKK